MLEKIKHKKLSLRTKIYNHTDAIPRMDWNSVNHNLFLSIPYLKALEDTLSKNMDFRYIIFYSKKSPVALAVTQLINFNPTLLNIQEFPCKINTALKKILFKNLDVKVLVCGNLFSCGEHGFVYDTTKLEARSAFENLSIALRKIRKTESSARPSFILLKEFWPASFSSSDYIKNYDFKEFEVDVNMVVDINKQWGSFQDYLDSMRTKFRTRAKKVFQKSQNIKVQDFNHDDILNYKNDINRLYLSVIEKADFKIGKLNASTFRSIKQSLDNRFVFKGYFLDKKLVGFTTAFILEGAVDANHIGIDYDYNTSHAIYQKMLYDYVALSIELKTKELRLGRTAEIIKSCVGAKPTEMKLYVRHGNSISNRILKPLVDLIAPSEYEIRNPFKLMLD